MILDSPFLIMIDRFSIVQWVIGSILHGGPIELFSLTDRAPRLVYQIPWYVLSCLWDDAYKMISCCYLNGPLQFCDAIYLSINVLRASLNKTCLFILSSVLVLTHCLVWRFHCTKSIPIVDNINVFFTKI